MHIQYKDGDDNGEGDENHGEEKVLAYQRDHEWGGRDGFRNDKKEHSEREEYRDAQCHFLATVWWKVEDEYCQKGDEEAGDNKVDSIEEGQSPYVKTVGYVWVDFFTAVVLDVVLITGCINDLPLSTLPEVFKVYLWANKYQVNLGLVIGPGTKLHRAILIVKGEVCDVHRAGWFEDCRRDPSDGSIIFQKSFGFILHQEVPNSTVSEKEHFNVMTANAFIFNFIRLLTIFIWLKTKKGLEMSPKLL